MELSFMIIDDSDLDGFIVRKLIEYTDNRFHIKTFLDASQALGCIMESYAESASALTLIFLDIQMPVMNGFEFLDAFESLPDVLKEKYIIVPLSSSVNKFDIARLNAYKTVREVMGKPITMEELSALLAKISVEYNIDLS